MPNEAIEEGIPGWAPVAGDDPLPPDTQLPGPPDPSTPRSQAPGTASTPPLPPETGEAPPSPPSTSTSSRTSSDPELLATLGQMASGIVKLAGIALNGVLRRKQGDGLWLTTPLEEETMGSAVANIAARRVPEELVDGDGGDVLALGVTAVGYGMRNAMGVTAEMLAAHERGETPPAPAPEAPGPAGPPVMAPKRAEGPPAAPPSAARTLLDAVTPTAAPPSVITPDI